MKLILIYSLLASIATLANIGGQELAVHIYNGRFSIMASMVVGTLVGLVLKYFLDKRYVFRFRASDATHDGKTFLLYAFMGLVTTVIFWGFELGFKQIFDNASMRYAGAVLGLALGYFVKYRLDRKFVFRKVVAP